MLLLYLVRQGGTQPPDETRVGARHNDSFLSPEGRHNSRLLGHFLAARQVKFSHVWTSTALRSLQTARHVCGVLGIPAEQTTDTAELEERFEGDWEGRLKTEVYSQDVKSARKKESTTWKAPGGESLDDVHQRLVNFADKTILEWYKNVTPEEKTCVAVVADGPVLKCLISVLLKMDSATALRMPWQHTAVSIVSFVARKGWTLRLFNDTSHLLAEPIMQMRAAAAADTSDHGAAADGDDSAVATATSVYATLRRKPRGLAAVQAAAAPQPASTVEAPASFGGHGAEGAGANGSGNAATDALRSSALLGAAADGQKTPLEAPPAGTNIDALNIPARRGSDDPVLHTSGISDDGKSPRAPTERSPTAADESARRPATAPRGMVAQPNPPALPISQTTSVEASPADSRAPSPAKPVAPELTYPMIPSLRPPPDEVVPEPPMPVGGLTDTAPPAGSSVKEPEPSSQPLPQAQPQPPPPQPQPQPEPSLSQPQPPDPTNPSRSKPPVDAILTIPSPRASQSSPTPSPSPLPAAPPPTPTAVPGGPFVPATPVPGVDLTAVCAPAPATLVVGQGEDPDLLSAPVSPRLNPAAVTPAGAPGFTSTRSTPQPTAVDLQATPALASLPAAAGDDEYPAPPATVMRLLRVDEDLALPEWRPAQKAVDGQEPRKVKKRPKKPAVEYMQRPTMPEVTVDNERIPLHEFVAAELHVNRIDQACPINLTDVKNGPRYLREFVVETTHISNEHLEVCQVAIPDGKARQEGVSIAFDGTLPWNALRDAAARKEAGSFPLHVPTEPHDRMIVLVKVFNRMTGFETELTALARMHHYMTHAPRVEIPNVLGALFALVPGGVGIGGVVIVDAPRGLSLADLMREVGSQPFGEQARTNAFVSLYKALEATAKALAHMHTVVPRKGSKVSISYIGKHVWEVQELLKQIDQHKALFTGAKNALDLNQLQQRALTIIACVLKGEGLPSMVHGDLHMGNIFWDESLKACSFTEVSSLTQSLSSEGEPVGMAARDVSAVLHGILQVGMGYKMKWREVIKLQTMFLQEYRAVNPDVNEFALRLFDLRHALQEIVRVIGLGSGLRAGVVRWLKIVVQLIPPAEPLAFPPEVQAALDAALAAYDAAPATPAASSPPVPSVLLAQPPTPAQTAMARMLDAEPRVPKTEGSDAASASSRRGSIVAGDGDSVAGDSRGGDERRDNVEGTERSGLDDSNSIASVPPMSNTASPAPAAPAPRKSALSAAVEADRAAGAARASASPSSSSVLDKSKLFSPETPSSMPSEASPRGLERERFAAALISGMRQGENALEDPDALPEGDWPAGGETSPISSRVMIDAATPHNTPAKSSGRNVRPGVASPQIVRLARDVPPSPALPGPDWPPKTTAPKTTPKSAASRVLPFGPEPADPTAPARSPPPEETFPLIPGGAPPSVPPTAAEDTFPLIPSVAKPSPGTAVPIPEASVPATPSKTTQSPPEPQQPSPPTNVPGKRSMPPHAGDGTSAELTASTRQLMVEAYGAPRQKTDKATTKPDSGASSPLVEGDGRIASPFTPQRSSDLPRDALASPSRQSPVFTKPVPARPSSTDGRSPAPTEMQQLPTGSPPPPDGDATPTFANTVASATPTIVTMPTSPARSKHGLPDLSDAEVRPVTPTTVLLARAAYGPWRSPPRSAEKAEDVKGQDVLRAPEPEAGRTIVGVAARRVNSPVSPEMVVTPQTRELARAAYGVRAAPAPQPQTQLPEEAPLSGVRSPSRGSPSISPAPYPRPGGALGLDASPPPQSTSPTGLGASSESLPEVPVPHDTTGLGGEPCAPLAAAVPPRQPVPHAAPVPLDVVARLQAGEPAELPSITAPKDSLTPTPHKRSLRIAAGRESPLLDVSSQAPSGASSPTRASAVAFAGVDLQDEDKGLREFAAAHLGVPAEELLLVYIHGGAHGMTPDKVFRVVRLPCEAPSRQTPALAVLKLYTRRSYYDREVIASRYLHEMECDRPGLPLQAPHIFASQQALLKQGGTGGVVLMSVAAGVQAVDYCSMVGAASGEERTALFTEFKRAIMAAADGLVFLHTRLAWGGPVTKKFFSVYLDSYVDFTCRLRGLVEADTYGSVGLTEHDLPDILKTLSELETKFQGDMGVATVVHGDYHVGNLFFDPADETLTVIDVCSLALSVDDKTHTPVGCPARDLSNFQSKLWRYGTEAGLTEDEVRELCSLFLTAYSAKGPPVTDASLRFFMARAALAEVTGSGRPECMTKSLMALCLPALRGI